MMMVGNALRRIGLPVALLLGVSALGSSLLLVAGGRESVLSLIAVIENNPAIAAAAFATWALVANCLVLPAGSLSLIAGGAVLGTPLPAAIWFIAQLITAPLLYKVAQRSSDAGSELLVQRYIGAEAAATLSRAADAGVATTIVMRLTPILPNAPATMIASWAGIRRRDFMIGSAIGGWVRPLYFASAGSAAGSMAQLGKAPEAAAMLLPLGLPFACAVLALYLRVRLSKTSAFTATSGLPPK